MPVMTAVCTAKPVRSTCSRNSWVSPARSVAAAVVAVSVPPALLLDDGMVIDDDAGIDDALLAGGRWLAEPFDVHAVAVSATATSAVPAPTRVGRTVMDPPGVMFRCALCALSPVRSHGGGRPVPPTR